jgi:flagella basal body P-ring formation protein FlgA
VWTSEKIINLIRWHRRGVAAVLAGVVVFAALSAVTAKDSSDLVTVVVASRLVAPGSTVTVGDVKLARMPPQAVPDGVITQAQDAVGKVAGTGIRAGQILTDLTLVGGTETDGTVVLSVRLDNPELASLAPPGTRVTLYATTSAQPVASHVLVVAVPAVSSGNVLSGSSATVLLVRVTSDQAGAITMAMSSSTLTLAIG